MTSDIEKLIRESVSISSLKELLFTSLRIKRREGAERVSARPVMLRGEKMVQFAYQIGEKEIHRNYSLEDAGIEAVALMTQDFSRLFVRKRDGELRLECDRKGIWRHYETKIAPAPPRLQATIKTDENLPAPEPHNRTRAFPRFPRRTNVSDRAPPSRLTFQNPWRFGAHRPS